MTMPVGKEKRVVLGLVMTEEARRVGAYLTWLETSSARTENYMCFCFEAQHVCVSVQLESSLHATRTGCEGDCAVFYWCSSRKEV